MGKRRSSDVWEQALARHFEPNASGGNAGSMVTEPAQRPLWAKITGGALVAVIVLVIVFAVFDVARIITATATIVRSAAGALAALAPGK